MTPQEGLAFLRREVPATLVGKLPRVTCGNCTKNKGTCEKHAKAKCHVCAAWVSTQHIHLDYVGHAETTDALLDADPGWSWEPLAFDGDGLPKFDQFGGLWIRLTVCGVTRLGYGSAENGTGNKAKGDLVKEVIGDALRNAAMRFGWALNLWAKTDLHEKQGSEEPQQAQPTAQDAQAAFERKARAEQGAPPPPDEWSTPAPAQQRTAPNRTADGYITDPMVRKVNAMLRERLDVSGDARHEWASQLTGRTIGSLKELTYVEGKTAIDELSKFEPRPMRQRNPAPVYGAGELPGPVHAAPVQLAPDAAREKELGRLDRLIADAPTVDALAALRAEAETAASYGLLDEAQMKRLGDMGSARFQDLKREQVAA
jgi:hypothetical protein